MSVGLPPSAQAERGIFWPGHKGMVITRIIVIVTRERKPSTN